MQNINIKNSQDAIKAYSDSANAYSGTKMKTASVDQLDAFEKVGQVQYDRNSSVDTNAQTVMDNFNEYRKDMQEKAKQEQQEETSDEEQARADAREIARSLTSEEIKKLRMMGVDVASASLSDIEGLVTSMRADARKDALVNVLAQAQIEEGDASNLVFTSSGAQIAGTDVKLQVGNKDILYLLKNRQPLTQETLYKAHYSGQREIAAVDELGGDTAYAAKQAAQQTISRPQQSAGQSVYASGEDGNADSGLQAQLAHVIMQAGFVVDETSMAGANLLLANDIQRSGRHRSLRRERQSSDRMQLRLQQRMWHRQYVQSGRLQSLRWWRRIMMGYGMDRPVDSRWEHTTKPRIRVHSYRMAGAQVPTYRIRRCGR